MWKLGDSTWNDPDFFLKRSEVMAKNHQRAIKSFMCRGISIQEAAHKFEKFEGF